MSSFTRAALFMPIVDGPTAGNWLSVEAFSFFESDTLTGPSIDVGASDESNGADIPPLWAVFGIVTIMAWPFMPMRDACIIGLMAAALIAWLFPKVHAEYIGAVFVHDIGLTKHRHLFSRRRIDKMFLTAMRLQRWKLTKCPEFNDLRRLSIWALKEVPLWAWRYVRPYLIFGGVSLWGILKERRDYFHPIPNPSFKSTESQINSQGDFT